jgi:hypothetical protein
VTTVGNEKQAASAPGRDAAELCAVAELGDDARALLTDPNVAPKAFLGTLMERENFPDAIRFLAHALPKRESVWWAWVCARKAAGAEPPPPVAAALAVTERWIVQPTDELRRAALVAAETADLGTPAGCAAMSAFLTGGSVAPAHVQPPVPPPEFASAQAVAGAVILAAVTEPKEAPARFREYLGLGLEVAERTKLWG